ncbi:MAG: hypothetical protein M3319_04935 [Actinomycetota bacterium]|nr:hypothetical protein [Actinomycetota bacterium]MDQ3899806.1 hypothetical protein [Actinomycetota bacterium]
MNFEGTPELQLAQRAYQFIDESLRNAERTAHEGSHVWIFAIANIAQGIELLLKERLRREHPVLVFADIERNRSNTVTFSQALLRLERCGVRLPEGDLARIKRARNLRNGLIHYVANVTEDQLRAAYIDFFEFAHVFHLEQLGEELHQNIDAGLWGAEAALMEEFRRDFLEYQGATVIRHWPSMIVEAQFWPTLIIDGIGFKRIKYGDEDLGDDGPNDRQLTNCHDCAALPGQFHVEGCDMEQCPRCKGQLLSCNCDPILASELELTNNESDG